MSPRSSLGRAAWPLAGAWLVLALGSAGAQAPARAPQPNVVLIVLDDVGVERLAPFSAPDEPPPPCTPRLDALAREGLVFRNAFTNPVCSPTRAQLLTGRHGFRTGIGQGIAFDAGPSLRVEFETMLPRLLGRDSSAVGKWHLLSLSDGSADHPLDAGFGYYAGSLFNLGERWDAALACRARAQLGYTNWLKTYDLDGSGRLGSRCTQSYATSDTVDEAILRARLMRPPWFLYVAFNAPHWPVHDPPRELCPRDTSCARVYCGEKGTRKRPRTRAERVSAMLEALDTELGRLLDVLRTEAPDTLVFVIGDNGSEDTLEPGETPEQAARTSRGKSSLFEGGIHVPLLAAGPGVVPGECDALVSSTDLYATLAELAGVEARAEDSISLVPYLRGARQPLRRTVFAEVFIPNQPNAAEGLPFAPTHRARALRDARFKLMRTTTPEGEAEAFYDLSADPRELSDLLAGPGGAADLVGEPRERYLALRAELAAMGP